MKQTKQVTQTIMGTKIIILFTQDNSAIKAGTCKHLLKGWVKLFT